MDSTRSTPTERNNKESDLKRSTLGAAALLASALALPAFAQGSLTGHPYIGAAGGASHLNGGCAAGVSCDNNDTAWKIYGGWTFPGDFAAELTYYDLGKFSAVAPGTSTGASLRGSYWGLGGAWLPQFGTSGWGAAVRLGAAYGEGKLDVTGFDSQTRDDWHPYGGLGVSYAFSKNVKVEADLDWTKIGSQFTDPGTGITQRGTDTVRTYMIGATYTF
jgi:OOP family OmpA-OmpF porin